MTADGAEQGREPTLGGAMLKLPLRGRTGCRWVPLVIVGLIMVGGAIGASYWFVAASSTAVQVPTVNAQLSATPSATLSVVAMATPGLTPTVLPTASQAPVAAPTSSPTPAATETRESPAVASPTPTVTGTPTAAPTTTPAALPTFTLTAVSTPAPPTPREAPTPEAVDCDPSLLATIERAAQAQAAYMEGRLDAADLAEAWGGAGADAQSQAERMMAYHAGDIAGVNVTEVEWSVESCVVRAYRGWVQAAVSEQWRYTAQLTCTLGNAETSTWAEAFPSELYALVPVPGGWRIQSWLSGRPDTVARWRCSGEQQ